jgi:hypothetical protein
VRVIGLRIEEHVRLRQASAVVREREHSGSVDQPGCIHAAPFGFSRQIPFDRL